MDNEILRKRHFRFIKQCHSLYTSFMEEAAKTLNITKAEAEILSFLMYNPELNSAINAVKHMGMSKANVSKTVMMLQEKKLVYIEQDEKDRRVQHIHITKSGEEFRKYFTDMEHKFANILTGGISDEEKNQLYETLNKMMDNIEKAQYDFCRR